MERFLKKHKLETDEEAKDLRQPDEAAANGSDATLSKLSRNDEINLQIKIRQYCENYIAQGSGGYWVRRMRQSPQTPPFLGGPLDFKGPPRKQHIQFWIRSVDDSE